jgi:hypothetical protein
MLIVLSVLLLLSNSFQPPPALTVSGRLDQQLVPEASGIVKSRRYPDIFWVHNDSGNPPLLFAIHSDGRIVRQFRLEVPNLDWEDIAIDDQGHLYLGDIGNNTGILPLRAIYRIDEPDPAFAVERPLKASAVSFYSMPRSIRFDAESLVYDRGTAIVVAKYLDGREAELFTVPMELAAPLARPARPVSIGRLPGFVEPATGASLNQSRSLLAVCSYKVTRIYRRGEGPAPQWQKIGEVRYEPTQIEGIAWDGADLVLVAEGGPVYRLLEKTWRGSMPSTTKTGEARAGEGGPKRDAR